MHIETNVEFNLAPIDTSLIRSTLRNCAKGSSPGDDCITYHHLWNLPISHSFLAQLFSAILLESNKCPPAWCKGKIILINKDNNRSDPSSYRPIALTSCIGKLYHKILAHRLEKFCLANSIIDPTIQKGFLHSVSGAIEHIASINHILDQAKDRKLPACITFLDLRNAFGSIQHNLIMDMLHFVRIPHPIIHYIKDCYQQLQGYISTKDWITPPFYIRQGVFQGDTLSPVIFLLAVSPILHLASTWSHGGFRTH